MIYEAFKLLWCQGGECLLKSLAKNKKKLRTVKSHPSLSAVFGGFAADGGSPL